MRIDYLPDSQEQHEYDWDPYESGEEEEQQDGRSRQNQSLNSAKEQKKK